MIALLFLSIHLVVPLAVMGWFWRSAHQSRLETGIHCLFTGLTVSFLFMWGQWPLVGSYYLRFIFLGLFLVVAWRQVKKAKLLTFLGRPGTARMVVTISLALASLLLGTLNIFAIRGHFPPGPSVALAFPLRNGTHYVSSGGDSAVLNVHFKTPHPGQKYAIDISKLKGLGKVAQGLFPKELDRHVVFGEEVYSPCFGFVIQTHDGEEDHLAGFIGPGTERSAANSVAIDCQGVVVHLSHMKKGSVRVEEGERYRS